MHGGGAIFRFGFNGDFAFTVILRPQAEESLSTTAPGEEILRLCYASAQNDIPVVFCQTALLH
jgi:hypothetical protein